LENPDVEIPDTQRSRRVSKGKKGDDTEKPDTQRSRRISKGKKGEIYSDEEEEPPVPVSIIAKDPPGTGLRSMRLSRKTCVTPGRNPLEFLYRDVKGLLESEFLAIERQEEATMQGMEVHSADFGMVFEAI
jgi:hypothetical protein